MREVEGKNLRRMMPKSRRIEGTIMSRLFPRARKLQIALSDCYAKRLTKAVIRRGEA